MIDEFLTVLLSSFVTTRRRQHMERPPSVSAMKKDNCLLGIWTRAIVSCKMPHQHVFLSHTGKQMIQSSVASALSSSFGNSGYKQRVSCTKLKKCAVTNVDTNHPQNKGDVAAHMCYRVATAEKHYHFIEKQRNSLKCTQTINDTLSTTVGSTSQVAFKINRNTWQYFRVKVTNVTQGRLLTVTLCRKKLPWHCAEKNSFFRHTWEDTDWGRKLGMQEHLDYSHTPMTTQTASILTLKPHHMNSLATHLTAVCQKSLMLAAS